MRVGRLARGAQIGWRSNQQAAVGRDFLGNQAAQKDWTIRMMQFFDYYLKGTKEPRWMKEGIHLRERGIDQKYDLLEK